MLPLPSRNRACLEAFLEVFFGDFQSPSTGMLSQPRLAEKAIGDSNHHFFLLKWAVIPNRRQPLEGRAPAYCCCSLSAATLTSGAASETLKVCQTIAQQRNHAILVDDGV